MGAALLSAKIYALAIAISMAVAVLIKAIGAVTAATAARPAAAKSRPAAAPSAQAPPPEHVAAITAAVSAALGAHRIVRIEERTRGQAWTAEGRSRHHGSHAPSRAGQRPAPPERKR